MHSMTFLRNSVHSLRSKYRFIVLSRIVIVTVQASTYPLVVRINHGTPSCKVDPFLPSKIFKNSEIPGVAVDCLTGFDLDNP